MMAVAVVVVAVVAVAIVVVERALRAKSTVGRPINRDKDSSQINHTTHQG